jgi:hypothetical protein
VAPRCRTAKLASSSLARAGRPRCHSRSQPPSPQPARLPEATAVGVQQSTSTARTFIGGLPAVSGHSRALMRSALAAYAFVHIRGVRAVLEVVAAGSVRAASNFSDHSSPHLIGGQSQFVEPRRRSLLLVIVAAESDQSSSSKPVDHSRNADDCDDGRNHIGDDIQHAGENSNAQKADAREERYPADLICSPRSVPLRHAPNDK